MKTRTQRGLVAVVVINAAAFAYDWWQHGLQDAVTGLGAMLIFLGLASLVFWWIFQGEPEPRAYTTPRPLRHGETVLINGKRFRLSDPDHGVAS